jgi:hypothetical protein
MFFEKRTQSSIKHRRLRYLLLFALRLALILLLVLAFANPFINRSTPVGGGKRMLVVAVDRSFSMHYGDRLDRAKREAMNVLSALRPGDTAQIVALAGGVQALTQPTSDTGELRGAVQAITISDGRSSFGELARFVRALAQSSRLPIDVHLASDLQKSALPPGFSDLRLPADTKLVLHSVSEASSPNWTVENVNAPRRVYEPKKARVQATIAGFATPAGKRTVTLSVAGKTLDTKTVDVPASGRARVEFISLDSPYGFSKAEVRIDSADKLAADDRFIFAVERADQRKVLFLYDTRRPRSLTYYRAALDSSAEAEFQLVPLPVEQSGGANLSQYAFVVLSDIGSLPFGFEDKLKQWVSSGGSVLVAAGSATAAMPRVPVFDEAIEGTLYAAREGDRFLTVGQVDEGHPSTRKATKFAGVKFLQAVRINTGKARVIARLGDQTPIVLEKPMGEGRVMVFASTFDNVANDLPLHASFIPFVEQTATYLGGGVEQPVNIAVDSYFELRRAKEKGQGAEVIDPDGKRLLSLKEATTAENFLAGREGFYEVRMANGRHEMVAAHADRRESDLTPIPQETLALWQGTGGGDNIRAGTSTNENGPDERPWPFGPWFLVVLLLVAVAESIIASRYLRAAREDDEVRREAA